MEPTERQTVEAGLARRLRARGDVVVAYVHGSFLQSDRDPRDVDIAILLTGRPSPMDALHAELGLERDLSEGVPIPVDVRVLNHAPLEFQFRVLERGRILVERDGAARVDHECRVHALYRDFVHHLETYRREALGIAD